MTPTLTVLMVVTDVGLWAAGVWLGYVLGVRKGRQRQRQERTPRTPLDQLSPDDPGTYAAAKGMIERAREARCRICGCCPSQHSMRPRECPGTP